MRARLLCWNLAGRVRRVAEQIELVAASDADLICLQEVSPSTARAWHSGLRAQGWAHVLLGSLEQAQASGRSRPVAVLTATRGELAPVAVAGLPWPERVLAARSAGAEIVNVHSPISQRPGLVKVMTHEAVHAHLAAGTGPRILCGDLNTPRREHPDGTVWTFARTRAGKLRPERGQRWDAAELALIRGLEPHGFRDAFRELYGPQRRELSWEWQRSGGGYRLDHLIVSAEVRARGVLYLHEWRHEGLSDHSALLAELDWEEHGPPPTG